MAFLLKCRSAVVEEGRLKMEQLIWSKIETMNEDWVQFWRDSVGNISRVLPFIELRGVARVEAVRLKGIRFDCN